MTEKVSNYSNSNWNIVLNLALLKSKEDSYFIPVGRYNFLKMWPGTTKFMDNFS